MPITSSITNFYTPDAFVQEVEPPASVRGSSIGVIGVCVQAIRGAVAEVTLVGSLSEFVAKFGDYTAGMKEDFMFVYNLFKQGANQVKVVRVTDGDHATASLTLNGTVYELNTPGTWGNSVTMTRVNSTVTGYMDVTFAYGSESYFYQQVTMTDTADARYFPNVLLADANRIVTITTEGTTNHSEAVSTFTGGLNGTLTGLSLTDASYTGTDGSPKTGLVALGTDEDVEIVALPRANATANGAVKDHVTSESYSPRLGVCAIPSGSTVSAANAIMASFNSDRLVMVYPFVQIANPYSKKNEYHIPNAFYAGMLSKLSYHESPSRRQLAGVISTEHQLSRADVDSLSKNRIASITLIPGQGFVVRNGLTTSGNPSKAQVTRRRAVNYFAKTFESGSQQFVSRPHTPELRLDVLSAFGQLLETEVILGRIGNVNGGKAYGLKCDTDNNPDSIVKQGKLILDCQISLWSNADFIIVRLDASEAKTISIE